MFVAGEHCDKHTMQWTKNLIQKPVLDNWWQTGEFLLILFLQFIINICSFIIKLAPKLFIHLLYYISIYKLRLKSAMNIK